MKKVHYIMLLVLIVPITAYALSNTVSIGAIVPGCGDGIISGDEQCDGINLGGLSCSAYGFKSGPLLCSPSCIIITDSCTNDFGGGGGFVIPPPPPDPDDKDKRKDDDQFDLDIEEIKEKILDIDIKEKLLDIPLIERLVLAFDNSGLVGLPASYTADSDDIKVDDAAIIAPNIIDASSNSKSVAYNIASLLLALIIIAIIIVVGSNAFSTFLTRYHKPPTSTLP